jgi:hypothetical protein
MKKILMFVLLACTSVSYSQTKDQVDQRLIENKGSEIYTILTNRKEYYKFLVWELANGYEVVNSNTVSGQTILSISTIVDGNNVSFTTTEVNNASTFNFVKFNFVRQKNNDVYYDLGNGTLLKFKALIPMWKAFDDSGLNNKL